MGIFALDLSPMTRNKDKKVRKKTIEVWSGLPCAFIPS